MNWFVSPRWQVRLWLADLRERVYERYTLIHSRFARPLGEGEPWFDDLMDRLSPWVGGNVGYKRTWVRRISYRLRYPRWYLSRGLATIMLAIANRLAPYEARALGKFECIPTGSFRLKAIWLYDNRDYATADDGSVSDGYQFWFALYADVDVPWSTKAESWTLTENDLGFVDAHLFDSEGEAAKVFRNMYQWNRDQWLDSNEPEEVEA